MIFGLGLHEQTFSENILASTLKLNQVVVKGSC